MFAGEGQEEEEERGQDQEEDLDSNKPEANVRRLSRETPLQASGGTASSGDQRQHAEVEQAEEHGAPGTEGHEAEDGVLTPHLMSDAGGEEGGEGDGIVNLEQTEILRVMKESLQRVVKAGTKNENVGTLIYDNILRFVTDSEFFTNLGKAVLQRAFMDMMAHIMAFTGDATFASECIPWIALRHVHYGVPLEALPAARQALLQAMEQLSGDAWDATIETLWGDAYDKSAKMLADGIVQMSTRLKTLKSDWEVVTQQLGMEALSAKVSANLVVASMHNSPTGKGGLSGKQGLAQDVCALIEFLVNSIQDLNKLRGVVCVIGIPWGEVFSHYKTVPNLEKIQDVVMITMQVGLGVDEGGAWLRDAWKWLWGLAVQEKSERWTSQDKDRMLQGWQAVESVVIRRLAKEAPDSAAARDFYADDDDRGPKQVGIAGDDPEGEKALIEDKDGISSSAAARRLRQQALKERLEQSYPIKVEVCKAIVDRFFDRVVQAPTVLKVFDKRRELYDQVFEEMTKRFMAYNSKPDQIWVDDPELALRHINFGVMPADLKIFSLIFQQAFADIAGNDWHPAYRAAWARFFNISTTGLSEVILAALHPITKALVLGSYPDLLEALGQAPRGKRSEWCCSVTIKGETRSPIYWMIEMGRVNLCSLLLQDILSLKANKSGVYYGRDVLWRTHGYRLVETLCQDAPVLIETLLDGHMWVSDLVSMRKRRVIFYVRELWGDLRLQGRSNVAAHPVMMYITEEKWRLFAKSIFVQQRLLYLLFAVSFSLGFAWLKPTMPLGAFLCRIVAVVSGAAIAGFEIVQSVRQFLNGYVTKSRLPVHLTTGWTIINLLVFALVLLEFVMEAGTAGFSDVLANRNSAALEDSPESNPTLAMILIWSSLVQTTLIFRPVMKLVLLLSHLLVKLVLYGVFLILVTFGFASALFLVGFNTSTFGDFGDALTALLAFVAGNFTFDFRSDIAATSVTALLILYMFIMYLLLLKVLVAIFGEAAVLLQKKVDDEVCLARMRLVGEIENSCTPKFLEKVNDRINFNEKLCFDDELEKGPDGGIAIDMPGEFLGPGYAERGRCNRILRYDCEGGAEVPWPREPIKSDQQQDENQSDMAQQQVNNAVDGLGKLVKGVTNSLNRIIRIMKSSGNIGDGNSDLLSSKTGNTGKTSEK
uniref:Globin family profile domain-containing protein n=1 Tax=Chromera velia CCMP2878 TaxID=1169474 RepID=A0A0G4I3B4_9ALVE|eukprot:Cvel_10615.t1-p1 / transcript=Cvel_10615.t1 / gene=Cvel_10615 / organism=Chromera_velia_CCMP2878 / gene_product=hypothetical protein / transcript_product=hypothetical protein / location=Cvel_scaffold644:38510-54389(+) / protein_length=1160 / sequence_SO=supercontig / SO=protein_coding / is_pseudo=false